MISYFVNYHGKLLTALLEHLELVFVALLLSLLVASVLTTLCMYSRTAAKLMLGLCSVLYSIPSIAMFAMLIPFTGLGKPTAFLVLVIYNQYLLLQNFLAGLNEVDAAVVEAASGMGMTTWQILVQIRLPLAKKTLFAGIRLASTSTVGIAAIAASINAGGLGTILFDGLRTMNIYKILWGSLLSGGLAIVMDSLCVYSGCSSKRLSPK